MRDLLAAVLAVCLVTGGVPIAVGAAPAPADGEPTDAASAVGRTVGPAPTDAATAGAGSGGATAATQAADNTTNLTVIAYTDIGSAASGTDGRMGRFITLIDRRRAAAEAAVVVGNGDEISPHALRTLVSPGYAVPVRALNVIDPAAEAVQNHELDYDEAEETGDFSIFENASNASEFPWLLANVRKNGSGLPGTQNATIVERGGVRVGIFAVADDSIDSKTDGVLTRNGWSIHDPVASARRIADRLKSEENVDVVIALTPVGLETAEDIAIASDDIDVVVSGDTPEQLAPTTIGGTVVTQPRSGARGIAEINLTVTDGEVTDAEGRNLSVGPDLPRNESWANYIDPIRAGFGFDTVVARTETPLDAGAPHYDTETAMGNVIADGMRNFTGADVAITNAGGIRGGALANDNVTGGDVRATLPFGNSVVVLELTGAELKAALRSQMTTLNSTVFDGPGIASQVSGVRFEWVPHATPEQRGDETFEGDGVIRDVTVGGEPLDENATYTVAVNSFIADGGSFYPFSTDQWVTNYENTTVAEAVIQYLEAERNLSAREVDPELQGRMRRVDRDGTVESVAEAPNRVVVEASVPEQVAAVTDEVYLRNASAGRVAAESVTFDERRDRLVVTFDRGAWDATVGPTGADVYAEYEDSAYSPIIRNQSIYTTAVLNLEVGTDTGAPTVGLDRFDTDDDGEIELGEVLNVITAFNTDGTVAGEPVTLDDVLSVITAFNTDQRVPV